LARAREGDARARDEIARRYEAVLMARVRKRLGSALRDFTESTDCLQDLFVEIFRGLESKSFANEAAFLSWATRVLENRLRDTARRRSYRAMEQLASTILGRDGGAPSAESPSARVAQVEEVGRLRDALDELPEDYRAVIRLRDLEQREYLEIAEELGRSIEATRRLHARAMARLASILARPR